MNRSVPQKLLIPRIDEPLRSDYQIIGIKIKQSGVAIQVDRINWKEFPFKPSVQLWLGYSNAFLWLNFSVKGDLCRLRAIEDQDAVWEDSCVEFFFAVTDDTMNQGKLAGEIFYRNFEFNALGVCLSACGTKYNRELLPAEEMSRILRFPELSNQNRPEEGEAFDWELSVAIPLDLLGIQPGNSFSANFYKCGDLTSKPHFLSWSSIAVKTPDFHLPQFFGEAELLK